MKKYNKILVYILIVLSPIMIFMIWFFWVPPRPLFHNYYGLPRWGIKPGWKSTGSTTMQAYYGNYLMLDQHLNMLVLIKNKNAPPSPSSYLCGYTENKARVLIDTPLETTIEGERNVLLVIIPGEGRHRFPLLSGQAKKIFDTIDYKYSGKEDVDYAELLKELYPDYGKQLNEILDEASRKVKGMETDDSKKHQQPTSTRGGDLTQPAESNP